MKIIRKDDCAVDLIGKKVKHAKFGEGVIIQQDTAYVTVKFMAQNDPKKFVYPSCFKTFLKLLNEEMEAEIDRKIKQYDEHECNKRQKMMEATEIQRFTQKMHENASKSSRSVEVRPFKIGRAHV